MSELDLELNLIVESGVSVDLAVDHVETLTKFVLVEEGEVGMWMVAVVLTTDGRMQELHRDYMGLDSPTDVMTFPADPVEGESDAGGDIVISVERAEEQGAEAALSTEDEIEFLIVHGLLHLCGWSDKEDADRTRMLDHQVELIRRFHERESLAN